ncbi:MAG: 3'(2'),5'-bisphosphate nucleotidase CysQ [Oceanicaulis sp.]|nr:3'(2'),5'-bisphosphate nucleotidase CysQ [Oceanicaulis sp.]
MTLRETDRTAQLFAEICLQAALPVMEIYARDFTSLSKDDRSPVTEADTRAEEVILKALEAALPGVPVLAEESFAAGVRPALASEFILVDPVDGTREFISRNGEFTINIALVSNRVPVAGAVYAPAREQIYIGGGAAFTGRVQPGTRWDPDAASAIRTRPMPPSGRIALMSRSHADEETRAFAAREKVSETLSAGSSLKFCLLAEGRADLYPRFGPTMEWDTAAGHAVLQAAGGSMTCPDGSAFLYAKSETGYRNGPFIARGQ